MKLRHSILASVFLLAGFSLYGQGVNVSATARAVDDHYNQLKSFKAAFIEIYEGPGVSRSESGVLWLKKPGRMRWEYRAPKEKLFLIDSHDAYFYVTGERQARKTALKNLDDLRSPLRYLLGKTKLEKELDALALAPDLAPIVAGDVVLRGVPRMMKDRVSAVILEISPTNQIHRIVLHGLDGMTTDFRFTPPPGVETFQDNQVAQ